MFFRVQGEEIDRATPSSGLPSLTELPVLTDRPVHDESDEEHLFHSDTTTPPSSDGEARTFIKEFGLPEDIHCPGLPGLGPADTVEDVAAEAIHIY